jgi:hypothetical protein
MNVENVLHVLYVLVWLEVGILVSAALIFTILGFLFTTQINSVLNLFAG